MATARRGRLRRGRTRRRPLAESARPAAGVGSGAGRRLLLGLVGDRADGAGALSRELGLAAGGTVAAYLDRVHRARPGAAGGHPEATIADAPHIQAEYRVRDGSRAYLQVADSGRGAIRRRGPPARCSAPAGAWAKPSAWSRLCARARSATARCCRRCPA
ncbi:MAG: hypothetical protein MZW92_38115 [Comamonadaceae bacterium]|nr:hypothetical protein [Comamonadaceae bacterium]